jgi:capsid protein
MIEEGLPLRSEWSWAWYFDGFTSLDPVKDAQAEEIRLRNGTTTYAASYAARGIDWEEAFEQRAIERDRLREHQLPIRGAAREVGKTNKARRKIV